MSLEVAEEVWRDIPEYEGYYQVSSKGRVRSVDRKIPCGKGVRKQIGKLLIPKKHKKSGRLQVGLSKFSKTRWFNIHKLVALTFIGPCPKGMEICHGPGGHLDNSVENLRYGTREENSDERWDKPDDVVLFKKLSKNDVLEIVRLNGLGISYDQISKKFDVTSKYVGEILRGVYWSRVTGIGQKSDR